jgi:outer membrane protein OmpA-like peptidoglycan-associated protein
MAHQLQDTGCSQIMSLMPVCLQKKRSNFHLLIQLLGSLLIVFVSGMPLGAQENDTVIVYFPFDKADLTTEATGAINQFLTTYKSNPAFVPLVLRGHCDAIGGDAYNDNLSERRVAAVIQYLKQQGLPDSVIRFFKGYGEREPRLDNQTAHGRQQNRRVEIIWPVPAVSTTMPPSEVKPKDTVPELTQETIKTVKEGQILRLRNINFYGGSHQFLPQAQVPLNELLTVMKDNPTLVIEIQGHICCMPGSRDGFDYDSNDWNLSHNRARAVYDFLYRNGVDPGRMTYKGFAGRVPLVYPEYTEDDRTTNRRVEIKIVKR